MGSDKATLLVNGEPLWARQIRLLRSMNPREIFVSSRAEPDWLPEGVGAVIDQTPSRGPLSGISAVLKRISTTHLLVLAVDLPRMTSAHLASLWAMAESSHGVIPFNGDYFEPLCAVYPREAGSVARGILAGTDFSLQNFAHVLVSRGLACPYSISAEAAPLYLNANRPDDLVGLTGID
jgi:molybdopterin-guanine dinucleotide biosynthesis protein A